MNRFNPGAMAVAIALLTAAAAGAQEHSFVGTRNCRKCHIREYRTWSETKMATAYESLQPGVDIDIKQEMGLDPDANYTTDEGCITCHVTGYGKPGGFTSIEETPELAGIGCEVCHGAGSTYLEDGYMTLKNKEFKRADLVAVGLTYPVDQTVCVECHNDDVPIPDYAFDYEIKKHEGKHEFFELKYDHE